LKEVIAQKNKLELSQSPILALGVIGRQQDKGEESERRGVFADYKINRQKQTGVITSKVKMTNRYYDSELVDGQNEPSPKPTVVASKAMPRQSILNTGSLLKAAEMFESKQPAKTKKVLDSSDEEILKADGSDV
jgi:hypothetical protein